MRLFISARLAHFPGFGGDIHIPCCSYPGEFLTAKIWIRSHRTEKTRAFAKAQGKPKTVKSTIFGGNR
jgi:hypothetical protein